MSTVLRNKQGNLSKVKYFLPHYRQASTEYNQAQPSKYQKNQNRKQSSANAHTKSLQQQAQISFQIVGISETTDTDKKDKTNKQNSYSKVNNMPKKYSIHKNVQSIKGISSGSKGFQPSLSSIRALTNSRQWKVPEGNERDQFLKFIQTLKNDQTYQQTITMFTIMYFYDKKKGK